MSSNHFLTISKRKTNNLPLLLGHKWIRKIDTSVHDVALAIIIDMDIPGMASKGISVSVADISFQKATTGPRNSSPLPAGLSAANVVKRCISTKGMSTASHTGVPNIRIAEPISS